MQSETFWRCVKSRISLAGKHRGIYATCASLWLHQCFGCPDLRKPKIFRSRMRFAKKRFDPEKPGMHSFPLSSRREDRSVQTGRLYIAISRPFVQRSSQNMKALFTKSSPPKSENHLYCSVREEDARQTISILGRALSYTKKSETLLSGVIYCARFIREKTVFRILRLWTTLHDLFGTRIDSARPLRSGLLRSSIYLARHDLRDFRLIVIIKKERMFDIGKGIE